ncbi:YeiH family protein [Methylotenera versatilis]|jgi:uncharacterized integral membrane protein (TIGR00698 family)|uniref:Uncharacterized protein family UPF0324 n=1 Tax=Methylotenera versatilis (strain 301) TaxID=666681 RepID=D7DJI2_METV0|nr:YeiH family protein [Methylotenera versatilis]ADI30217.1 Uncharacterized protein family UPF0324 [Methylotenera versatilis 301]
MQTLIKNYLPGIVLSLGIAIVSLILANITWLQSHAIGTLTIAIILGIFLGNTLYPSIATQCAKGVLFSKQRLLQLGIIFYGFRLTFADITHVGAHGALIDVLVLTSTFALAWVVGRKVFKLDTNTVILIGAGSSICGAAAVMATEPVLKGRAEQVSVAVSTVLVFGTMSMLLYPALFQWNLSWHFFPTSAEAFGIFTGSTVHEVAQVVAAAKPLGDIATNTAVIAKMVRVMMLAPFLILLSLYVARTQQSQIHLEATTKAPITIPWFAVIFVAVAGLNSLAIVPSNLVVAAVNIDTLFLAMAMASLGLCTHFSAIKQAGFKPMVLGGILFSWLIIGGALINRLVMG